MYKKKLENIVYNKHNTLVKTKHNLNANEFRIYLYLLYSIQKEIYVYKNEDNLIHVDNEYIAITFPRKNFIDCVSDKQLVEKKKLERILEGLQTKIMYYETATGWTKSAFIMKQYYDKKTDTYKFLVPPEIFDMIKNFKGRFTPLDLSLLFTLTGIYSFRLYELLRLWTGSKTEIYYTIEELKDYFMLQDKSSYNNYANFKAKVLLPAVEELNKLKLLHIDYEEIKEGRKTVKILFKVIDLNPRAELYKELKMGIESPDEDTMKNEDLFKSSFSSNNEESVVEDDSKNTIEKIKASESIDKLVDNEEDKHHDVDSIEVNKNRNSYNSLDFDDFAPGTKKKVMKELENNYELSQHNWSDGYASEAWDIAIMSTLDLGEGDKIGALQYKYFMRTLLIQLDNQINKEIEQLNREEFYKKTL